MLLVLVACSVEPVAVPAPPSRTELPPWFGDPDAPGRRIAGELLEGETPVAGGTVSLRIDAPDPTVWAGVEECTGPDGRFDFGELRAGRYTILATAPGKTSRVVEVDTTVKAADALSVYAHACTALRGAVTRNGRPVAGALVDIAGVHAATTDVTGVYTLCIATDFVPASIRAPGLEVGPVWAHAGETIEPPSQGLLPDVELRGKVIGADGRPAAGVAVQPVDVDERHLIVVGRYRPWPVQATTDARGRFVIRGIRATVGGASEMVDMGKQPARYHLRLWRGDRTWLDEAYVLVSHERNNFVRIRLRDARLALPPKRPTDTTIRGRVLLDGKPLPDADVAARVMNRASFSTYTRRDGSFDLELEARGGPSDSESLRRFLVAARWTLEVSHPSGVSTTRRLDLAALGDTGLVIDIRGDELDRRRDPIMAEPSGARSRRR